MLMLLWPPRYCINIIFGWLITTSDVLTFAGMEELEQSSYSAAINLAHKTTVKQEQPADLTPPLYNFGFVDVNVDGVVPTELICASGRC